MEHLERRGDVIDITDQLRQAAELAPSWSSEKLHACVRRILAEVYDSHSFWDETEEDWAMLVIPEGGVYVRVDCPLALLCGFNPNTDRLERILREMGLIVIRTDDPQSHIFRIDPTLVENELSHWTWRLETSGLDLNRMSFGDIYYGTH